MSVRADMPPNPIRKCRAAGQTCRAPRQREWLSCQDSVTVWPSDLRCWLQAPVRKGVGSTPKAVRGRDEIFPYMVQLGVISWPFGLHSGMIRASGARGPGRNSRNGPCCSACVLSALTSVAGRNLARPVSPRAALSGHLKPILCGSQFNEKGRQVVGAGD